MLAKDVEALYGRASSRTYRERARQAREYAEKAPSELKAAFLEVAIVYDILANQVEGLAKQQQSLKI
jgi:hypothetical protein